MRFRAHTLARSYMHNKPIELGIRFYELVEWMSK